MTLTVTLPDELAHRLASLPQDVRDSEVADALALKWEVEDDMRVSEASQIERGIAEFEAGQTMSHETFLTRWNEYRKQARAK